MNETHLVSAIYKGPNDSIVAVHHLDSDDARNRFDPIYCDFEKPRIRFFFEDNLMILQYLSNIHIHLYLSI